MARSTFAHLKALMRHRFKAWATTLTRTARSALRNTWNGPILFIRATRKLFRTPLYGVRRLMAARRGAITDCRIVLAPAATSWLTLTSLQSVGSSDAVRLSQASLITIASQFLQPINSRPTWFGIPTGSICREFWARMRRATITIQTIRAFRLGLMHIT